MKLLRQTTRKLALQLGTQWMPFADVATPELPLSRLLRLSMFQLSIGLATALLVGTPDSTAAIERSRAMRGQSDAWWQKYLALPRGPEEDRLAQDVAAKRLALQRACDAFAAANELAFVQHLICNAQTPNNVCR